MKPLTAYTEEAQTELFDRLGAFFAFSNKQLGEKAKKGIDYVSLGHGLICPKENAEELFKGLEEIHEKGIKARLNDYGLSAIAQYELANHEAQFTRDYSDAYEVLKDYGITEDQMKAEYRVFIDDCIENDRF